MKENIFRVLFLPEEMEVGGLHSEIDFNVTGFAQAALPYRPPPLPVHLGIFNTCCNTLLISDLLQVMKMSPAHSPLV